MEKEKPYKPTEEEIKKAEGMMTDEQRKMSEDREATLKVGMEKGVRMQDLRDYYQGEMKEIGRRADWEDFSKVLLDVIPTINSLGDDEMMNNVLEDSLDFYWRHPSIMRRGESEEKLIKIFDEAGRLDSLVDRVKNDLDEFESYYENKTHYGRKFKNESRIANIPYKSKLFELRKGYEEIVKAVKEYKEDI
jgi:hypothetical protein